jgi:glycosyltransferase involved in cell wall biosynthesis
MKKRLLIANDASYIPSGYGVYGKEILTRLHNSGKYEVAELGCYATESDPRIHNIPWKFYPNAINNDDPLIAKYKEHGINQFGAWRFNRCVLDFKPHIVFDIRDYWMSAYQEHSPYRRFFNWVIMPTVDSAPQKLDWYYTFKNADTIIPYTDWAKKTLLDGGNGKLNIFNKVANAGINPEEFYPIEDKESHKKKFFGDNVNIIGSVMRNQKRKLFPDLMYVFRKYLDSIKNTDQYDKTFLYLHTSYPEESGWNLPDLLIEYGICDKTFFTYKCKACNKFFPSKFVGPLSECKHCKTNNSAMFCSVANGVTTNELNEIYNLFDIYIQYAICEGFGMPQVEAAACGLPVASVDYSAMTEIVESVDGIKIPVKRLFRELETGADRSYPDNDFTVNMLIDFFSSNKHLDKNYQNNIRQKCITKYSWDNVYRVWDECFDSIDINSKVPWNTTETFTTNHSDMSVPSNLSPIEFISYICNNIIKEPYLINTAHVQILLRDICEKIIGRGGSVHGFGGKQLVEAMEQHLNNKIVHEQLRQNEKHINKESYLTCQKTHR